MHFPITLPDNITLLSEIVNSEEWKDIAEVRSDNLQELLDLIPEILKATKNPKTIKAYFYDYQRFVKWQICNGLQDVIPASEASLALYIVSLVQTGKSKSTIERFSAAVNWVHKTCRIASPMGSDLISLIINGAKRIAARTPDRKEPVTVNMLVKLKDSLLVNGQLTKLADKRLMSFVLLAFSRFLRFDEISKIERQQLEFYKDYLIVHMPRSKTDQFREGAKVFIARTGSDLCPVNALIMYLQAADLLKTRSQYIFRSISVIRASGTQVLRSLNKPIAYTTVKDILRRKWAELGYDTSKFGLHSFRSGGCTAAANSDINERLFQLHGRWASEKSKNNYILNNVAKRLLVSASLGL